MNPQDKLKELQRQIEAFKCGMEARYGKYWKDRADSTSLARYAEMIGKEKGYKQALEDARNNIISKLDALFEEAASSYEKQDEMHEDYFVLQALTEWSEYVEQILTIPEEE